MAFQRSFALAVALVVSGLSTPATAQNGIGIDDARARATVSAGQTSAVYLTIRNHGAGDDRLAGVASTIAERTQMHTTLQEQGVMKMRPLDGLDLPAGGQAEFMPGGNHIMLVGLDRPLKVGDHFTLTLRFEKAGDMEADVAVVAPGDIPAMRNDGHAMPMKQGTQ